MTRPIPTWLALAVSAALTFSCTDQEAAAGGNPSGERASTWDEVKAYTAERSEEFTSFLDRQLTELDGSMETLAASGGAKWEAAKVDLAAKRAALAEQMQRLGAATGSAWTAAKERTAELYEDLRDSIHAASADSEK